VKSWSVVDFALVLLGGYLGSGLVLAVGELSDVGAWLPMLGLAGQYAGFGAATLLLARNRNTSELGITIETGDLRYLALGVFLQLVIAILLQPVAEALLPDGSQPQQIIDRLIGPDASSALKIAFFTSAVAVTPFFEELMYRGILLRAIVSRGRLVAITATSIVFAAVHIPALDFENLAASIVVVMPPLLLLAAFLAWLTLRNDRLGPAIFLHSGWNFLAAIVLLIPNEVLESIS
jgi:membrane protease YdiL (CAAX protease family)